MIFKRFLKTRTPSDIVELTARQTRDMQNALPIHQKNLLCSVEKLQALRNKRLRSLLKHAKSYSPWYKKHLAHINIKHFTEQNLAEIPSMNKITLMNHWDDIVTDRRLTLELVEKHLDKINQDENALYLFEKYHVITTSGSSGIRGVFIYDWDAWNEFYIDLVRYGLNNHGGIHIFPKHTKKISVAIVNISNPIFATYSLHKTFNFNDVEKFHFPITLPFNEIINGLNRVQAEIIIGLPPTIHQLCQESSQNRLHIQPKVVITFGEPLHHTIRSLIKKTWPNVAIFNTFSSSEGLIGINCHANSHEIHLNDDACILQLVDKWNNPINKNKRSDMAYLTNLYNYTLPLIRYEIPEQLVFLDKICECGIVHQLIAEPLYRPEFDFTYQGDILVHHSVFDTPLLLEKNIREFQVVQTNNGVDVKIVTIGFINKIQLQHNICAELSRLGLSQPHVNIDEVPQLNNPASGKLRRFISNSKILNNECVM